MRNAAAVLGAVIVVAVWVNVAITLVIPRGRVGFIRIVDRFVAKAYTAVSRLVRSWERRDALLASQPIVTLGLLLFIWLAGFVAGFGLLLWQPGGTLPDAVREAASSLFTLGFVARTSAEPSLVDFAAAASGLVIVALQIAYLPTLYAACNRRETEVTLLGPRAGNPSWGPELLARAQLAHGVDQLADIYIAWERWSADVRAVHCPAVRPDGLHLPAETDPQPADPGERGSSAGRPDPADLAGVPGGLAADHRRGLPRRADRRGGLAALPGLTGQLRGRIGALPGTEAAGCVAADAPSATGAGPALICAGKAARPSVRKMGKQSCCLPHSLGSMNIDDLPLTEFGFPGPLRDRLVAAILSGAKTSTSGLLAGYEIGNEPLPEVGQLYAVVDSAGRRVAAIEVTEVRVVRLTEMDLQHALDEGEGDESVAQWRAGHEEFWHSAEVRDELGDPAFTVNDDTLVVAERFQLVDAADR